MTTIRKATTKDVSAIQHFRKKGNQEGEFINVRGQDKIKADLVQRNILYYVAEKDKEIVGQIICEVMMFSAGLLVKHIGVLESEKGTDTASQLMDKAKEEMVRLKLPRIELIVRSDNARAIKFYVKQGFHKKLVDPRGNFTYTFENKEYISSNISALW